MGKATREAYGNADVYKRQPYGHLQMLGVLQCSDREFAYFYEPVFF